MRLNPLIEVCEETIYSKVLYFEDRGVYSIKNGDDEKQLTEEYVRSMGWEYDAGKNELYKYTEIRSCGNCESNMLYDSLKDEFYCPICSR